MDERFHGFEIEVEEWHWWYRVRRDILSAILGRQGLDPATTRLLDVGCGTGGNALSLSKFGQVTGIDGRAEAFRLSPHRPYTHRVVADVGRALPFADGSFDVVCALDIIEHLDDDAACARELHRVCARGGRVIVFVPAFRALWGYNDVYSHHKRRYTEREVAAVLEGAGLRVEESGYFNMMMFLPVLAMRTAQRLLPERLEGMEHGTTAGRYHRVLEKIFGVEVPLFRRRRRRGLPFGTSAWCIATRASY
jgi:SAM-dependent methyltransferase